MDPDVIDFRVRTAMPDEDVDLVWRDRSGFLEASVKGAYADINARLRKRYPTLTATNRPEAVVRWMTRIVTPEAYRARGINPNDDQTKVFDADRAQAYLEIKEAADSQDGLYDLPVADASDVSAITKGMPLSYSEGSAYDWLDAQAALYGPGGRRW